MCKIAYKPSIASQGQADRRSLMRDFETRFATHLFSLEATLAQRSLTANDVADLSARLSAIEAQSGHQKRESTSVKRNVLMSAQPRFSGAQLSPHTFDGTT